MLSFLPGFDSIQWPLFWTVFYAVIASGVVVSFCVSVLGFFGAVIAALSKG